ncbi:DUF309 domain-containing protein, partial [Mesorhizobium sp. M1396]
WEAHEAWEPLWQAAKQSAQHRLFFKGLMAAPPALRRSKGLIPRRSAHLPACQEPAPGQWLRTAPAISGGEAWARARATRILLDAIGVSHDFLVYPLA